MDWSVIIKVIQIICDKVIILEPSQSRCWRQSDSAYPYDVFVFLQDDYAHSTEWCGLQSTGQSAIEWRIITMMTSSNGHIFCVTGHLCREFTGLGEFPAQRPVTRSFGVFFDLRLNKRLSKQPWGWWFETPSWSLWRHCNDLGRDKMAAILQTAFSNAFPPTRGDNSCITATQLWWNKSKCILLNENPSILILISLKFVHKIPTNNRPVLVQILACRLFGAAPSSEPVVVKLAKSHIRQSALIG